PTIALRGVLGALANGVLPPQGIRNAPLQLAHPRAARDDVQRFGSCSSLRGYPVSVRNNQVLSTGRRQENGELHSLPQELDRRINLADIHHDPRTQEDSTQGVAVGPQGHLVLHASGNEVI